LSTFRVATWNCADGFAKKQQFLRGLNADLVTVQEVRRAAFDIHAADQFFSHYTPGNTARGIASFASDKLKVRAQEFQTRKRDHCFQWLTTEIGSQTVQTLCAWTKPNEDYVRVLHRAVRRFLKLAGPGPKIIMGDLNTSAFFDPGRKKGLFRDVWATLSKSGFQSAYHAATGEKFGAETQATHWLTYNPSRAYHLDYILFAGMDLVKFELPDQSDWLENRRSDHRPLIAEFAV
jgi:endonuclease/exonuclease/phosphatase family metal-dependent hydrolase